MVGMRLAPAAVAAFVLCACGSSPSTAAPGPSVVPGSGVKPATSSPSPTAMNYSGALTQNATWVGTINITARTTINPGVTVTVKPGTTINVTADPALSIFVNGTLDIQGTKAARVIVRPTVSGGHWHRFVIGGGGQLTAHYLVESGGGFLLTGGKVTLIDSAMSWASGDLLEGVGTADVEYSSIGLEAGNADSTHCDMHFNPGHNTLKITHTNVSTSVYGIMFYGGAGADFTYDNWFSNSINVETVPEYQVSGDFSGGWFAGPVPSGPGITANNLASKRLPVGQAGPRP